MSQPTRQQIINAHGALSSLTRLADNYLSSISGDDGEARLLRRFILRVLPPKPQPTMDEISWDDELHYLAEAEGEDGQAYIMIAPDGDTICCIYPRGEREKLFHAYRAYLTPTGKRYTLTETTND